MLFLCHFSPLFSRFRFSPSLCLKVPVIQFISIYLDISRYISLLPSLPPSLPPRRDQDAESLETIDLRSVVTSSCTGPLGKDPPGFRVVRVFSARIDHEYYALDNPPKVISLEGDGD